jgi:hypothetical protein
LICCCCSQTFDLCHIFKGPVCCLYVTILPFILAQQDSYTAGFSAVPTASSNLERSSCLQNNTCICRGVLQFWTRVTHTYWAERASKPVTSVTHHCWTTNIGHWTAAVNLRCQVAVKVQTALVEIRDVHSPQLCLQTWTHRHHE